MWLNKYIHVEQLVAPGQEPVPTASDSELLDFAVQCALGLTPFLEPELHRLRFELVSRGNVLTDLDSPQTAGQRRRDKKQKRKAAGSANKLAELQVHTRDWRQNQDQILN